MPDANPLPLAIDVHSVKTMRDQQADFLLLDCRERDEHDFVRIDGAVLIPMSELMSRQAELEAHRHGHIVVHCHFGGRSLQVTEWLRNQGFSRVQNMSGGIDAWAAEIDPRLPRY